MSSGDERMEEIRKALDGCKGAPELEGLAETAGSFYGMALDLLAAYDALKLQRDKAAQIIRALLVEHHHPSYTKAAKTLAKDYLDSLPTPGGSEGA